MFRQLCKFAPTLFITGLAMLHWGCAAEPDTPFGRGPQDDPKREIQRLEFLVNHGVLKGEQQYVAGVKVLELKRIEDRLRPPGDSHYHWLVEKQPARKEARVSYARDLLAYQAAVGRWYHSDQLVAAADRLLEPLIAKEPKNGEYYLLRAQLAGVTAGRTPRVEDLKQAERLLPKDARVELEWAEAAVHEQKPDVALARLLAAQKGQRPSAQAHYLLGVVAAYQGSVNEASRQYDLALLIDPDHVDALAARMLILWAIRDPEAGRMAQRLTDLSPQHPASTFMYAMGAWQNGRADIALQSLRSAEQRDPGNELYPRMINHLTRLRNQQINDLFAEGLKAIATGIVLGAAVDIAIGKEDPYTGGSSYPASLGAYDEQAKRNWESQTQMLEMLRDEEKKQAAERDKIAARNQQLRQMDAEQRQKQAMEAYNRQMRR